MQLHFLMQLQLPALQLQPLALLQQLLSLNTC
jgi:hypothetical protein